MGNGMNKVLPGLYVGNYRDSKDQQQLEKFSITHIIAIHDSPRRLLPDKHYLCVMAADTPDQNLSQYFSVCNDFIHAARLREGNVLIHCLAGMSRSVTVAVAYIMTATNLNWKEALKVVRAGRAVANPNVGFQTQLQEFEVHRLAEERRRMRERFPSLALEQLDRSKCMAALNNYEELLQNRDICEGNCTRGEKCPTGVCNMDPTKGLFRRRPSSSSTRSRFRPQASATTPLSGNSGIATAQSCPTSPKHSPLARRSIGEPKIPEDEETHHSPTTSSEAAQYAAAVDAAKREQQEQQQQQLQDQQQQQLQQLQQIQLGKAKAAPTTVRTPRVSSAGSRLTADNYRQQQQQQKQEKQHQQLQQSLLQHQQQRRDASDGDNNVTATGAAIATGTTATTATIKYTTTQAQISGSIGTNGGGGALHLQRSASTVSGLAVRPRSSPAGLYSYTGSVPSSVHGSRVDLRAGDTDKGSAIYLGCSAPRNSSLSLSSRGSSGGSAPPSPARTPPVSPRNDIRRATSLVKRQR